MRVVWRNFVKLAAVIDLVALAACDPSALLQNDDDSSTQIDEGDQADDTDGQTPTRDHTETNVEKSERDQADDTDGTDDNQTGDDSDDNDWTGELPNGDAEQDPQATCKGKVDACLKAAKSDADIKACENLAAECIDGPHEIAF